MYHYSTQQWAKALALIFGIFFVICILWGNLLTDPVLKELHMNILRVSLPGFSGLDPLSFVIGIVESVIYGLVAGWALASSLNLFAGK